MRAINTETHPLFRGLFKQRAVSLMKVLNSDVDELLLLAEKVPENMIERPDTSANWPDWTARLWTEC